jgi:hypothetical protein
LAEEDCHALLSEPLQGMWRIEGCANEHSGVLAIERGQLQLKLFIDGAISRGQEWHHPTLEALKPGMQPLCIGQTRRARTVTLLRCARSYWNALHLSQDDRALLEVSLWVGQAWTGHQPVDPTASYTTLIFDASGLHNILANARIKHELLGNDSAANDSLPRRLRDATQANEAYLVYNTRSPETEVDYRGKRFKIIFSTSVAESHSSHVGVHIQSKDKIIIKTSNAKIEELLAVKFEIEQFLSILCIGRFAGQNVTLRQSEFDSGARLLWRLGQDNDTETAERMPHEVLTTLGQRPELTEAVIRRWFAATEQRSLARWLVYDTFSRKTFSNPRFLALAQAWEIIGRENSAHLSFDKSLFTAACDEAGEALEKHLGQDAADRLTGMLKSNNRPSFRTLIEECLKRAPPYAVSLLCGDVENFARIVTKTRNVLTHLQTEKNDKFDLHHASNLSFHLTFKLTVLFCVLEAQWLELPLDNLSNMLANNSMAIGAQRPLPN